MRSISRGENILSSAIVVCLAGRGLGVPIGGASWLGCHGVRGPVLSVVVSATAGVAIVATRHLDSMVAHRPSHYGGHRHSTDHDISFGQSLPAAGLTDDEAKRWPSRYTRPSSTGRSRTPDRTVLGCRPRAALSAAMTAELASLAPPHLPPAPQPASFPDQRQHYPHPYGVPSRCLAPPSQPRSLP